MQTTSKIFVSCLLCFTLMFVSGCGGSGGSLTGTHSLSPAEQAEVDKYIADYGTLALAEYMETNGLRTNNEERLLRFVKYLVSKGADVNAKSSRGDTPLYNAKFANNQKGHPTVIKYLESKGGK